MSTLLVWMMVEYIFWNKKPIFRKKKASPVKILPIRMTTILLKTSFIWLMRNYLFTAFKTSHEWHSGVARVDLNSFLQSTKQLVEYSYHLSVTICFYYFNLSIMEMVQFRAVAKTFQIFSERFCIWDFSTVLKRKKTGIFSRNFWVFLREKLL